MANGPSAEIIYGHDDRRDIYELDPLSRVRADATAVLAMVSVDSLTIKDGQATLNTAVYGVENKLCDDQRFWAQRCVQDLCSCFLVAPDMVATAAHCAEAFPREKVRFIAGFEMIDPKDERLVFPLTDVYEAKELIWRGHAIDAALFRLNRSVRGVRPAHIQLNGRIGEGGAVHTIGFPMGLPKKYSDGGHSSRSMGRGAHLPSSAPCTPVSSRSSSRATRRSCPATAASR
ncbi:trypsin-like serine peptidase [Actinoallomurus iriomotensis]|uniref:Peptidase S1 domain-containing protein n=1 Tax=Actinoallomurus iriomotensis TaxID=478107 RepID=A0A9W6RY30_9ACTN|nr:trypsin-like serine protease [Actinoallomurus iriomotensis]GLY84866.1 hypothetical protein Airi02_027950 [Actinoallomurus iriomotensis]